MVPVLKSPREKLSDYKTKVPHMVILAKSVVIVGPNSLLVNAYVGNQLGRYSILPSMNLFRKVQAFTGTKRYHKKFKYV